MGDIIYKQSCIPAFILFARVIWSGICFLYEKIYRLGGDLMICPACGTENERGFKFCVKCGSNLDNPQEVNYEQVDMGNYHTEEEFSSDKGGFTMGNGTFKINDRPSGQDRSDLYTADELNDSEENFDFSMYDEEPFIPRLDSDRVSLPRSGSEPMQPQQNKYSPPGAQMGGMPNQPAGAPAMGGMPAPPNPAGNPYMNQQGMMYAQPQVIGYDASGMPIYGQPQPMMYGQPQVIGYDASGMPIYGQPQPMMYGQPPVIGYDANGMPIYGQVQPMMYAQPQIIGYDASGMPVYGQAQPQPQQIQDIPVPPQQGGMPGMQGMQGMPGAYGAQPQAPKPQKPEQKEELVDVSDDFWKFFDGGTATKHREPEDDFFGKSSHSGVMNDLSASGLDMGGLRRPEKKKNNYMNDTPVVDAKKLAQNDSDKFNKFYMRSTGSVNSSDLSAGSDERKHKAYMKAAQEVDADMLSANTQKKSRITMYSAGQADPDTLEAYTPEHKEALMGQAERAVEALPKKVNPYESELDKIELPEYMQAKKTSREETIEIPDLPQVGIE